MRVRLNRGGGVSSARYERRRTRQEGGWDCLVTSCWRLIMVQPRFMISAFTPWHQGRRMARALHNECKRGKDQAVLASGRVRTGVPT
eukprot:scaffold236_cov419-Prasinococcus_capsulatus_cf.AAC.43